MSPVHMDGKKIDRWGGYVTLHCKLSIPISAVTRFTFAEATLLCDLKNLVISTSQTEPYRRRYLTQRK